jgi:hypothetical protein
MHTELRTPDFTNVRFLARAYDPELDDIRSILSDVCKAMEGQMQFAVSGFGQERWPVDVRTDLAVFLEQLPEVLHAVRLRSPAEIDFYEQGIERKILLSPDGDDYLASCVTWTEWQPSPAVEQLSRASLEQMLIGVQDNFMRLVRGMSPELAKHEWVRSWLSGQARRYDTSIADGLEGSRNERLKGPEHSHVACQATNELA